MNQLLLNLWIENEDYSLNPGQLITHFNEKINYVAWFNLRSLWTKNWIFDTRYSNLIYCIYLDNPNVNSYRKVYIGKTDRTLNMRLSEHLENFINSDSDENKALPKYAAINKYKARNFKVYVLEDNISIEDLNNKEIYYINKFKSNIQSTNYSSWGYNLTDGGDGGGNGESLNSDKAIKSKDKYAKSLGYNDFNDYFQHDDNIQKSRIHSLDLYAQSLGYRDHGARFKDECLNASRDSMDIIAHSKGYSNWSDWLHHDPDIQTTKALGWAVKYFNNRINALKLNNVKLTFYNFIRSNPSKHNNEYIDRYWDKWVNDDNFYNCDYIPEFAKSFMKFLSKFTSWNQLNEVLDKMEQTGEYY